MKTISYLLNDNLIIIEKGAYKVAIIYQLNYVVVVSLTYDVEGKPFVPLAKSCSNAGGAYYEWLHLIGRFICKNENSKYFGNPKTNEHLTNGNLRFDEFPRVLHIAEMAIQECRKNQVL